MGHPGQPFGDKIIMLAGDFKLCLPVVPGASIDETVDACINKSWLWVFQGALVVEKYEGQCKR